MEVESVSIGGQIDGEEREQEREYEIERAESGIYIRIQYSGVYVLVVLRRVDTTCRIQWLGLRRISGSQKKSRDQRVMSEQYLAVASVQV